MDTAFLKPLYEAQGRTVSVYIDTERTAPQADHAIGVRWAQLRKRLHGDGADGATLDAVAAVVGSDHRRGTVRARRTHWREPAWPAYSAGG